MKKVLIILYYWPPAGGSAVQRWLRFCKHLPKYGWEPIVYVPSDAYYQQYDHSIIKPDVETISYPIIEPLKYYEKITKKKIKAGMSMSGTITWKHKILWWIRSNLFIPDAHFLWIRPSVRYLEGYLKYNHIDAIVTSGPPHSLHLIGRALKKKTGIRWIADFRDPWTSIDYFELLSLTKWARKRHHKLESKVLSLADHIIVVNHKMKKEFNLDKITTITNGYDVDNTEVLSLDTKFSLTHIGTLSASRNCTALWEALKNIINDDFELNLAGDIDKSIITSLQDYGLMKYAKFYGIISHHGAIRLMKQARVLLLIVNNSKAGEGIVTGKIFEYLSTDRPILILGPDDSDLKQIILTYHNVYFVNFDDVPTIRSIIKLFYDLFNNGDLCTFKRDISEYSGEILTKKLMNIL